MKINSETAYRLEKYRFSIYFPIFALFLIQVLINLAYREHRLYFSEYNLYSLVSLVVSFLCYALFYNQAKWVTLYSTMCMEEWRAGNYENYLFKKAWSKIKNYPIGIYLITILLAIVYYFLPQHLLIDSNKWAVVWQVHSSILGLVFVILPLLIGAISTSKIKINTAKRLARRVSFSILTISNLVLNVLIGVVCLLDTSNLLLNTLALTSFAFLIISIIYLFKEFTKYLIEEDLVTDLVLEELKENLRNFLTDEIKDKLSQQVYEKMCGDLNIDVGYISEDSKELSIRSSKQGKVTDINIFKVIKLARIIKGHVQVKNYKESTFISYKAILKKGFLFHSTISDKYDVLAVISSINKEKDFKGLIQRIFKIETFEKKDRYAENLKQLTDSVIEYLKISPNKSFQIVEFIGELINESLQTLKDYKIEFSGEKSKDVTTLDWRSIGLLIHSLDEIYVEIFRTHNQDLIIKILSFVIDNIQLALKYENHFLLKQFIGQLVRLYYLNISHTDNLVVRKKINEMIQRRMVNFIKYNLDLDGDNTLGESEFETQKAAILEFQNTVKEILRISFSEGDAESTPIFTKTLKETSSTLRNHQHVLGLRNSKMILESENNKSPDTEKVKNIQYLEKVIELNDVLSRKCLMISYALGAWLMELHKRNDVTPEFVKSTLPSFQQNFTSVKDLAKTFFEVKRHNRQEDLGLSSWELSGKEQGVVHTIQLKWLEYFFIFNALRLIPNVIGPSEFIYGEDFKEYSSSYLEAIAKEVREVTLILESNKDLWEIEMPTRTRTVAGIEEQFTDFEKKENLFTLLDRGVKEREKEESEFLKKADIDMETWNKFKADFFTEYENGYSLKEVVKKHGLYINLKSKRNKSKSNFGINTLDFKYRYLKEWFISTFDVAENYARSLTNGENKMITDVLKKNSEVMIDVNSDEELIKRVDFMISDLINDGYKPSVILIGNRWKGKTLVEFNSPKKIEEYTGNNDRGHLGSYKGLEVYYTPDSEMHNKIIVTDLKRSGRLIQKQIINESEEDIRLSVKLITDNNIDEWIKHNAPAIYLNGKKMTKDEARPLMAERVILDISESFDYSIIIPKKDKKTKKPSRIAEIKEDWN